MLRYVMILKGFLLSISGAVMSKKLIFTDVPLIQYIQLLVEL